MEINEIKHPEYQLLETEWLKYRKAFIGGTVFIEGYLQKYSTRESNLNFDLRKKITYSPSHAKAALLDVKNSIYQRLSTVSRTNGPSSYQEAITGLIRGVDLQGRTMDDFIGSLILEELLVMGKVGVYIDKPIMEDGETILDARDKRPYLYYYKAENILSWSYDNNQRLISLLLQDTWTVTDKVTGLITGTEKVFRLLVLTDEGVTVTFYNLENEVIDGGGLLKLDRIPFVIFELSESLMTDIADYQIALLNLASSDMRYATVGNFPFYTEQRDASFDLGALKSASPKDDGSAATAKVSKKKEIDVGTSQGRSYPKGTERPAFIHPSSEPLLASMEKQDKLIAEIRQIINLSITNLKPQRASQESKEHDNQGLEAGLSYIGMELNYGEREIAEIWAQYEGSKSPATITYPKSYKLQTEKEKREEAKDNEELMGKIPSQTYKKIMAKKIAKLTLGPKATPADLSKIEQEIDAAPVMISNAEDIRTDHEAGFVGDAMASQLRGYPKDEYKKAQQDHAKRAARILIAQTKAAGTARGVEDVDSDNQSSTIEKKQKEIENE